jgi:hypothetical protein
MTKSLVGGLQEYPYPLLVVCQANQVYTVVAIKSYILAMEPARLDLCQLH